MRNQQAAKQLIDEGVVDEVNAMMKTTYINMWANQTDPAERERLWLAYNMVDDCLAMFRVLATGSVSDAA